MLSAAYFPPIPYIFALSASCRQCNFDLRRGIADEVPLYNKGIEEGREDRDNVVYIEACENYQKQSYRNRCNFYAASGKQSLTVPIVHEGGTFSHPITEIRIDYSKPWLQQHTRALISAYKKSAFFDYYWDGLSAIFNSRPETLWELDLAILRFILSQLNLRIDLRFTESFTPPSPAPFSAASSSEDRSAGLPRGTGLIDLREVIHPKRPVPECLDVEKPYFQVFVCKHGFIPNLSVMDLLFNEGPDAYLYLY
ncbi:MAG: WbqC family protein [Bacteroidales bacterium]|nr:WbqC family protein [Bacteroidales bacterium]